MVDFSILFLALRLASEYVRDHVVLNLLYVMGGLASAALVFFALSAILP